ncbi:MAG: DUF2937 family protein [Pseudomonadota bacterium]
MIVRVLALAGGLAAGGVTSQFPKFSQQYVQRLGGAVDALEQVVADFDASAAAVGLSRSEALAQMQGTDFLDRRRADMSRTIDRYDRLRADLADVQNAGPFMRAYHASALTDNEVGRATMEAFAPAVPLTPAGAIFAGTGFLAGLMAVWAVLRLMLWPLRRRPA